MKKLKILVVDDSVFFRKALEQMIQSDDTLEVIGSVSNAYEAERKIKELSPDVVTLDIEMPGLSGPEFVKKIMPIHPVPIVLVSSASFSVFDALAVGAVDFVKKPNVQNKGDLAHFAADLLHKIKIASLAKIKSRTFQTVKKQAPLKINANRSGIELIAIGASTGGTEATLEILKELPKEIPGVVITQHMPPNFTRMYAERLDKLCSIDVKEAKDGDMIIPGTALIAPGDFQMSVEKDARGYRVRCRKGEKVSGHCPSVDVLFQSVAKHVGKKAIGVILTGMGRDGADGLLQMRKTGSYTIGQNKETCVVYGMPMVAYNIGAVIDEAPIQNISNMIIKRI